MPFGNEDPIDKHNRERIRALEDRNLQLAMALAHLCNAFERSASMTQGEKELAIIEAREVLTA